MSSFFLLTALIQGSFATLNPTTQYFYSDEPVTYFEANYSCSLLGKYYIQNSKENWKIAKKETRFFSEKNT